MHDDEFWLKLNDLKIWSSVNCFCIADLLTCRTITSLSNRHILQKPITGISRILNQTTIQ